MSLHFPLPWPKIRTFRFSLHTSRLSLHGEVTIFPCQKFAQLAMSLGPNHTQYKISLTFSYKTPFERELRPHTPLYVSFYRKRGSASYIVREVLSVRERERETERERRKWRHHCRAKIGDEFTLSLAKNSQLAMSLHFPLPKIRTSRFSLTLPVSPFTERLPLWRWKSQWVHTFHCQNFFRPLCSPPPPLQTARAARRVIENPRQMIKSHPVLFCSSHRKNESN